MAQQPSPTKKGTRQPPPSNISDVPSGGGTEYPATPVRSHPESRRKSARRSHQKIDFQTLPGTRWDELDIERQRERQRGRATASNTAAPPSFDRLSLRESSVQVSSQGVASSESSKGLDLLPQQKGILGTAKRSEAYSTGSSELLSSQTTATASSPVKKHHQDRSLRAKQQLSSKQPGQSTSETGPSTLTPSLSFAHSGITEHPTDMARRPGRNQVDYVAELKEAIHESLSKLSDIQEKLAPLGQQIVALEEELKAKESDSTVTLDDTNRLDELYRAMVKLTEQESGILHSPPDDLINKMGILNALAAREDTQAPSRGSAASKQRGSKRSTVDSETAVVDSPGPSPSDVRSSDQLRRVKGQGQRSSSVVSQTPRDGNSKLEEGAEGPRSNIAERAKILALHAEVAYKQSKTTHDSDGERIHCTINGIRKDKGSGRAIYDIKDKDESENLLYTARVEDLLPIPAAGSQLPSFPPGKHVIALYPGTTTFYNAQVISLFAKRDVYSLKFEGEENEKEVKEVERRYVLDTKAK